MKKNKLSISVLVTFILFTVFIISCEDSSSPQGDAPIQPTATASESAEPSATPEATLSPSSEPTAIATSTPESTSAPTSTATPESTSVPIATSTPAETATPAATPSATPEASASASPSPSPTVTAAISAALFDFETGTAGSAPITESSILPTVVEAVVSTDRFKTGAQSVKISDTSSTTAGSFRATSPYTAATGTFRASIYIPSGVDGTTYMDVWAGGNNQSSNLVMEINFSVTDQTIRYRQSGSQRIMMKSDGSTSMKWVADSWNVIVVTWTSVNTSNVLQVTVNGEQAKTNPADTVAGSTPVINIPAWQNGKTPDRIELKYGTSSGVFTSSVYIDNISFF